MPSLPQLSGVSGDSAGSTQVMLGDGGCGAHAQLSSGPSAGAGTLRVTGRAIDVATRPGAAAAMGEEQPAGGDDRRSV